MTLEQQVANLVSATTDLTTVVNTELSKVRAENETFKNTVVSSPTTPVIVGAIPVFSNTSGSDLSSNSSLYIENSNNIKIPGDIRIGRGKGNVTGHSLAIGTATLANNTDGLYNIAVGGYALTACTTGLSNTAVGSGALMDCTIGDHNTGVGGAAFRYFVDGSYCTAIGANAMNAITSSLNSTAIGSNSQVSGSNQVQLGNSSTTTYVFGTVQNRSDVRDKTDVRNTILGLDFIKSLRPVDYRWDMREDYKPVAPQDLGMEATDEQKASYQAEIKTWLDACKLKNITHNGTKKRNRFHHGLIAQEVKAVLTQKGIDFGGYQDHSISGGDDVLSLGYDQFIAPLIKAVQELSAQNEALIARISALESNLK
jgi:hypothetical protein